jgi:sugar lactone lactonase YvrE
VAGLAEFEDRVYSACTAAGDIKILQDADGQLSSFLSTDGVPNALAFDSTGAVFVSDLANKCIKSKESNDPSLQVLVGEYEGRQFAGPNSLCFDKEGTLFFTDSGPMGDTSLARPKGSVFCVKLDDQLLKPLALECLAYPSGIAVSDDGCLIYVAETMANRILRFVKRPNGVYYSSVFYTFSGGFGPSALVCDAQSRLFVARFEFGGIAADGHALCGLIAVIGADGKLQSEVEAPGPEVMGLMIKASEGCLFVSEQSTSAIYSVHLSELDLQ